MGLWMPATFDVIAQMPQNISCLHFLSLIWTAGWSSMQFVLSAIVRTSHDMMRDPHTQFTTNFCTNRPEPESGICGESLLRRVDDDKRASCYEANQALRIS